MTFKVLILARKRPELGWQEFVNAYERHCDWMQERIASGILAPLVDYRRNYILPAHRLQTPSAALLDFDVVAEAWFVDEDGLDGNMRLAAEQSFLDETTAELSQYLQLESIRYVPVLEMQKRDQMPASIPENWSA